MQIIRRCSFSATPWKNGGGITHEAARFPVGAAQFDWRVSLADVDASGPFSDFAGYHRVMMLLRGDGIRLTFGNGQETYLRQVGDLVEFDGALPTGCELLGGPCVDFNLMVSAACGRVDSWVEALQIPHAIELPATRTALVFCVTGAVTLSDGTAAAERAEALDLALTPAGAPRTLSVTPELTDGAPLVFWATLGER